MDSARRRVQSLLQRYNDLVSEVCNGTMAGVPVDFEKLIAGMADSVFENLKDEQKARIRNLVATAESNTNGSANSAPDNSNSTTPGG